MIFMEYFRYSQYQAMGIFKEENSLLGPGFEPGSFRADIQIH